MPKTFKELCGANWPKRWNEAWEHEIHDWFTDGHCYVLAIELAKRHGWEVWACDVHAVARRPDGVLVDADGEHPDFLQLNAVWKPIEPFAQEKASHRAFRGWALNFSKHDERRIKRWAKRLAEKLCPD